MIPFSQRQVYAQPNSKRTLVPELAVRYNLIILARTREEIPSKSLNRKSSI